ncbi:histidine phosphatase superfamily [Mycena epipterygia]|nr:histidine phosphatase superfamily [Mycena epipterygia]
MATNFSYRAIPGFFDVAKVTSAISPRLGLIDDSPNCWNNLRADVARLNADPNTSVKVIFFIRHGEAIHDLAKIKYGHEAWDAHWSLIDGDDDLIWGQDPALTAAGRAHAGIIHDIWKAELQNGILLPDNTYCSPLRRALETNEIIFRSLLPVDQRTTIIDSCRRIRGGHTCDRRRSRTEIISSFPASAVEPGFAEQDELWRPDGTDTPAGAAEQACAILNKLFHDESADISVTAHGRIIAGFLSCLGVSSGVLRTGGRRLFHCVNDPIPKLTVRQIYIPWWWKLWSRQRIQNLDHLLLWLQQLIPECKYTAIILYCQRKYASFHRTQIRTH